MKLKTQPVYKYNYKKYFSKILMFCLRKLVISKLCSRWTGWNGKKQKVFHITNLLVYVKNVSRYLEVIGLRVIMLTRVGSPKKSYLSFLEFLILFVVFITPVSMTALTTVNLNSNQALKIIQFSNDIMNPSSRLCASDFSNHLLKKKCPY